MACRPRTTHQDQINADLLAFIAGQKSAAA